MDEQLSIKKYKIKVANRIPNYSIKEIYKLEKCYLGISINNPFFLSNHLDLLIEWIAKRFKKSKVVIGDHLHRINAYILYGIQGEEAIQEGLKRGVEILEKLNILLPNYPKDLFQIDFWEKYYNDAECQAKKNHLYKIFNENNEFRASLINSSTDFIERQIKRGCHISIEKTKAIDYSIEYLLEEMAVFSILIKRGYKVQVYPGNQLNILKELAIGKYPDIDSNLINGIYVDLVVKKIR